MRKAILFSATWCYPCSQFKPIFKEVTKETKWLDSVIIDTDTDMELFNQYNVRSIPTVVVVDDNGNEIKRMTGATTKDEFAKWLTEVLK